MFAWIDVNVPLGAWYPHWLEDRIGSSGTGITDNCGHPGSGWKSNLGPLWEQKCS